MQMAKFYVHKQVRHMKWDCVYADIVIYYVTCSQGLPLFDKQPICSQTDNFKRALHFQASIKFGITGTDTTYDNHD